jgi:hypothetical protein
VIEVIFQAIEKGGPAIAVICLGIAVGALWKKLAAVQHESARESKLWAKERKELQDGYAAEQKELQEARIAELREVLSVLRPVEELAAQVEILAVKVEQLLAKSRR